MTFLETNGVAPDKIGRFIVAAELKTILNQDADLIGYRDARKLLDTRLHLFGFDATQTESGLFSYADLVSAGLATVFDNLGIPAGLPVRFKQVLTPFGFSIYVVEPIIDKELQLIRLSKQADSAA